MLNRSLIQLHELFAYIRQRGVILLLVMGQPGILGDRLLHPVDISYLADTVLLVRLFESSGQLKRALSVLKRRGGHHEDTIREFQLAPGGITIGEPLTEFQGVLTGVPDHLGRPAGQGVPPDDSSAA